MTDPTPTPQPATPLWQPQQTPDPGPMRTPDWGHPTMQSPIAPTPPPGWSPAPYEPPQTGVQQPYQPVPMGTQPLYGQVPYQQVPYQLAPPVSRWKSSLPVEPMRYSQFLHTPRRRWWKLPLALLVAGVAWLIGLLLATIPALVYEVAQRGSLTDPQTWTKALTSLGSSVTPAVFLANNVSIILMIPAAWLGLIVFGQRPRWLSSITGRLRWKWMFTLMGLMLIPYLAMQAFDALGGAYSGLTWRPYSLFMILTVLLTTPLQCAGEEYGTRGLINRLLGSYGSSTVSFWIGALGSSTVFMFLHGAGDPYLNTFYFLFGMVACWMAWRTGGLEASIAMHVVNNVLAMSTLPFSDISGIFNRQAGTATALEMVPLAIVMVACVGIVEWQSRRRKIVAVAAPGLEDEPPKAFAFRTGAAQPGRAV